MDFFIDKYEQLEQTNRLLENIEAKLNAMNVPQVDASYNLKQEHAQSSQRAQNIHPFIDNYLLDGNNRSQNGNGLKQKDQSYPKIQLSTQVLQDDLLISGYDNFKSGSNQFNSGVLSTSLSNANKVNSNAGGGSWNIQDNSKTIVNAYETTQQINHLLLGETESQLVQSDAQIPHIQFTQNSSRSRDQQSSQSSSNPVSNTSRSNRSKQQNKSTNHQASQQNELKSATREKQTSATNQNNSKTKITDQKKQNKMFIGSGYKDQLIKIEENQCDEEDLDDNYNLSSNDKYNNNYNLNNNNNNNNNYNKYNPNNNTNKNDDKMNQINDNNKNGSPFGQLKQENQMQTQNSPVSLDYTKSLNNTQQNTVFSLQRNDDNLFKNNSQLEDELNTLRNRLYQINHSYSKLTQQQSLSGHEVQNSQRKIYSLAQQMKDIAESLQTMNHLKSTQQTSELNSGYRFQNQLSDNRSFSSGKKINKLSADKYEDNIIDDKVFLLEKENRRLKKENQMLKDEIEEYKDKMNKLFNDHQSTRQSLEKHLELKFETQLLNMKEAQKLIINEKDCRIQNLQRQLEEQKSERELMRKEIYSFRQSYIPQRLNTSSQVSKQTSLENRSFEQPYQASYYLKNNIQNDNKLIHDQSQVENSILSQNYGYSNTQLDKKRQVTPNFDHLKQNENKIQTEPINSQKFYLNEYVRTEIDQNLLKNNKYNDYQPNQKTRQSTERIKSERAQSKDAIINTQKPPKLKKGLQEIPNHKKSRSKTPINYSEQIQHIIKQSENLNKLKASLRPESSLSNSRKETQTFLIPSSNQAKNKKNKKTSPQRSKSTIGHRTSTKI